MAPPTTPPATAPTGPATTPPATAPAAAPIVAVRRVSSFFSSGVSSGGAAPGTPTASSVSRVPYLFSSLTVVLLSGRLLVSASSSSRRDQDEAGAPRVTSHDPCPCDPARARSRPLD